MSALSETRTGRQGDQGDQDEDVGNDERVHLSLSFAGYARGQQHGLRGLHAFFLQGAGVIVPSNAAAVDQDKVSSASALTPRSRPGGQSLGGDHQVPQHVSSGGADPRAPRSAAEGQNVRGLVLAAVEAVQPAHGRVAGEQNRNLGVRYFQMVQAQLQLAADTGMDTPGRARRRMISSGMVS